MEKTVHFIMYHYVRDLKNSEYPTIKGLDKELFEKQLAYLLEHYTPVRMDEILAAYQKNDFSDIPENGFVLTFDDGYIDHYEVVYPILKKVGVQGVFFPNTMAWKENKLLTVNRIHFILAAVELKGSLAMKQLVADCFEEMDFYRNQGVTLLSNEELYQNLAVANRWDPGEVIFVKRLLQNALPEEIRTEIAKHLFQKYVGCEESTFAEKLYMNFSQMKEMKKNGMFFGIHGYDHYWLAKLPKEQMQKDIDMALEAMDELIDRNCFVMNYPYGNYSEEVISYVKQKGCGLGVSVEVRGAQLGVDNRFALPHWDCNDVYPKGEKV